MRLIDADALIEKSCKDCTAKAFGLCEDEPICETIALLNEMPTIQATNEETSNKHGKWYHAWANDHFDVTDWECSECDWIIHNTEKTNFCPNCGADMREVKE